MYYAPLPSTRWALGMIISEEELFAPVRELSTRIVIIGILGLLFLAVISLVGMGVLLNVSQHATSLPEA